MLPYGNTLPTRGGRLFPLYSYDTDTFRSTRGLSRGPPQLLLADLAHNLYSIDMAKFGKIGLASKIHHRGRRKIRVSILLSFALMLVIPLALFTYGKDNFDIRNYASESDSNVCTISFPHVNPRTLQVHEVFTTNLEIRSSKPIKSYTVKIGEQELKASADLTPNLTRVNETILYTTNSLGKSPVSGSFETEDGQFPCTLAIDATPVDPSEINIIQFNQAPYFTTQPYKDLSAEVGIKPNDNYNFTLKAIDRDKDDIHYEYSFTSRPGETSWLKENIIKDGKDGELEVQYTGSTQHLGSYLANVFIHDGYKSHLSSIAWIISVEPESNDTPKIIAMTAAPQEELGPEETVKLSWKVEDRNQVVYYNIYTSPTPQDHTTWQVLEKEYSHNNTDYEVSVDKLSQISGTSFIIVEAVDNQDPQAKGTLIFGPIHIAAQEESGTGDTDDNPRLDIPQITSIEPSDGDQVENRRQPVKATLLAGNDATIVPESIVFTMDENDLLEQDTTLNIPQTDYETLLTFKPAEDLAEGEHRIHVAFEDSNGHEASKEWVFTVKPASAPTWTLFGWEIPSVYGKIIVLALIVLLLALLIPWILYLLWRNTDESHTQTVVRSPYTPPAGTNTVLNVHHIPPTVPSDTDGGKKEPAKNDREIATDKKEIAKESVSKVPLVTKEAVKKADDVVHTVKHVSSHDAESTKKEPKPVVDSTDDEVKKVGPSIVLQPVKTGFTVPASSLEKLRHRPPTASQATQPVTPPAVGPNQLSKPATSIQGTGPVANVHPSAPVAQPGKATVEIDTEVAGKPESQANGNGNMHAPVQPPIPTVTPVAPPTAPPAVGPDQSNKPATSIQTTGPVANVYPSAPTAHPTKATAEIDTGTPTMPHNSGQSTPQSEGSVDGQSAFTDTVQSVKLPQTKPVVAPATKDAGVVAEGVEEEDEEDIGADHMAQLVDAVQQAQEDDPQNKKFGFLDRKPDASDHDSAPTA